MTEGIGTTNLETNLKPALRELAARSERIVELAASWVGPSGMNAKGQRPEDNWKRAAGMGLLGGGPIGVFVSQPLAARADRSNVIYRKRDAGVDALKVAAIGTAGQVVGSLAANRAGLGKKGAIASALGGMALGSFGGYSWAKRSNERRIAEANLDRKKTRMAAAWMAQQKSKSNE